MPLKKPSEIKLLQSQVSVFGKLDTIYYYAVQGSNAGQRLDAALADKNALTAAKEARDIVASINAIKKILEVDNLPEAAKK